MSWKLFRSLRRDPLQTITKLADQFGDIVPLKLGLYNVFLVNSPEYAAQILAKNVDNYDKNTPLYRILRQFFNNGLLTSEGAIWTSHRRLMQPAFHKARLKVFADAMVSEAEALLSEWQRQEAGCTVDAYEEMIRLTLRIVTRTLFSVEVDTSSEFAKALDFLNRDAARRFVSALPIPPILPFGKDREFRRARAVVYSFVENILNQRRRSDTSKDDLLGMLMEAKDADTGESLSEADIRDEVLILLLAGHETTANALTWTWYLLSQHPQARQKIEAELDRTLSGRRPRVEDLQSLGYTRMVIEESMRLYPPGWRFTRRARLADKLGDTDIPAGSIMVVLPYTIHRNPRIWAEPSSFDPERFAPAQSDGRHPFAHIPFGGGRRTCIGFQYAMMEMQLVIATMAQAIRLDLKAGHSVIPKGEVTLHAASGMPMALTRRHPTAVASAHAVPA